MVKSVLYEQDDRIVKITHPTFLSLSAFCKYSTKPSIMSPESAFLIRFMEQLDLPKSMNYLILQKI